MPEHLPEELAERFHVLDQRRSGKLNRARRHAELTIPALLPWHGFSQHQELIVPYNQTPAEGINNLASRTVSVIDPLGDVNMFELAVGEPPDQVIPPEEKEEMDRQLRRYERITMQQIRVSNFRSQLHTVMQHLIVVGDVLLMQLPDYNFRLYRLDQFVVRRDSEGEWHEIIIREHVDPDLLPERYKQVDKKRDSFGIGEQFELESFYTQITRKEDNTFGFRREFRGQTFDRNITFQVSPYFPLRWKELANEDYGRSLIEDMFGDIMILDSLSKSLRDGAALNAEHRWVINTTGLTELQDFMDSVNGEAIPGIADDIQPKNFQNHSQVNSALQSVQFYEQKVGRRFLMNSAVQPQGERVTARQVTILAQELENNLGGVLSTAARDIQIPIIRRTMFKLAQDGKLPEQVGLLAGAPQSVLDIDVKAGLEILQREAEFEKLSMLLENYAALPEEIREAIDPIGLTTRYITSMSIDTTGIVKSREVIEQERQARQQEMQAAQAQEQAMQAAQQAASQPQA